MAQRTLVNPRFRYNAEGLDAMATERRLVDAAETFEAGQFLRLATDGLIYAAVTDEDASTGGFQYFAMESVSTALGNDTTRKKMAKITEGDIFEINAYHATVASAVLTESMIGGLYALYVANNVCSVDVSDTSNDAFELVEPSWVESPYNNTSSDTYARGLWKVIPAVLEAARAS